MPPKKQPPTIYKTGNKPPTVYKSGNKPTSSMYAVPSETGMIKKTDAQLKQMYVQATKTAKAAEKEIKKRGINKPKMPTPPKGTGKKRMPTPPKGSPKPKLKPRQQPPLKPKKQKDLGFKEEK